MVQKATIHQGNGGPGTSAGEEFADDLAKLVAGLLDRVEELGDVVADRIRADANEFGGGCVPLDQLREICRAELRNILGALVGDSPLDTTIGTAIGRAQADHDVPESTLISGYRVGIRSVWELLIAEAASTGLVTPDCLVAAASSIWVIQDDVLEAAITSHRESTIERIAAVEQERSALIEALLTNRSPDATLLRATTDVLRMPRYDPFVVIAAEVSGPSRRASTRLHQALARNDIHSVWHLRPEAHVGIVHLGPQRGLERVVEVLEGEADRRTGVSPVYEDLYQTGTHLRYAEIAMLSGRADGCAVSTFDDNLAAAAAAAAPDIARRLADDVFGPLNALPRTERDVLLQTLETWLGCGGSTEETAKRLFCHPNTVRLRFRRITEHTGRSTSEPLGVVDLTLALFALRQNPEGPNTAL